MSIFSAGRSTTRAPDAQPGPGRLSVLARGLRVTGAIQSDGVVTIEGHLDGVIRDAPQVFVAPEGSVVGDVSAVEVVVGGHVQGDIAASHRVELQAGAVVQGDITTPRIVVHEGADVNGRFRIERPADTQSPPADQLRLSA